MRIGTWNLEGKWSGEHASFLTAAACDLWLLTEVREDVGLDGWSLHATVGYMADRRHWAAVMSTSRGRGLQDPHGASALAEVDGVTYCSSILPWRNCGDRDPWVGADLATRTAHAVAAVAALTVSPLVWGGDWNHALVGPDYVGSAAGRDHIKGAVVQLGLDVATLALPHRETYMRSIDHIAVPRDACVVSAERLVAASDGRRLSDHDAYVVEVSGL